jgi:hypothetical protein
VVPIVAVLPPKGLPVEQRAIWDELAPHALAARTLTPGTAAAFLVGCREVALERVVAVSDPAGTDHRGMLGRVEGFLLRFGLSPNGKPLASAEDTPVANPLDRFINRKRG